MEPEASSTFYMDLLGKVFQLIQHRKVAALKAFTPSKRLAESEVLTPQRDHSFSKFVVKGLLVLSLVVVIPCDEVLRYSRLGLLRVVVLCYYSRTLAAQCR